MYAVLKSNGIWNVLKNHFFIYTFVNVCNVLKPHKTTVKVQLVKLKSAGIFLRKVPRFLPEITRPLKRYCIREIY